MCYIHKNTKKQEVQIIHARKLRASGNIVGATTSILLISSNVLQIVLPSGFIAIRSLLKAGKQ